MKIMKPILVPNQEVIFDKRNKRVRETTFTNKHVQQNYSYSKFFKQNYTHYYTYSFLLQRMLKDKMLLSIFRKNIHLTSYFVNLLLFFQYTKPVYLKHTIFYDYLYKNPDVKFLALTKTLFRLPCLQRKKTTPFKEKLYGDLNAAVFFKTPHNNLSLEHYTSEFKSLKDAALFKNIIMLNDNFLQQKNNLINYHFDILFSMFLNNTVQYYSVFYLLALKIINNKYI